MTTNEPMSEQALTMIRELLADDGRQWGDYSPQELYRVGWSAELLLVELDRLRAREQALADENKTLADRLELLRVALRQEEARNAAMRPMIEALSCLNEAGSRIEPAAVYYALEVESLIEEAQQFVAAHPATATAAAAAGEAESEGE